MMKSTFNVPWGPYLSNIVINRSKAINYGFKSWSNCRRTKLVNTTLRTAKNTDNFNITVHIGFSKSVCNNNYILRQGFLQ